MSQRWRAVGNTVFNLTGPRFDPQTSRSRNECVTARPTGRSAFQVQTFVCLVVKCNILRDYYRKILQIKSNLSLYSLDYAEACNELAGPISASLRPGNTAPFEEMSQRRRAVGNSVSDLTGPRFEPQTSRSRDERVTARPTARFRKILEN